MPQTFHSAHQLFFQTPGALQGVRIAGRSALAQEFGEGELSEFECLIEIPGSTFIVNGQLFAGFDAVRGIAGQFVPECRRGAGVALAFGHERELPRGARPEFGREPRVESLDTGGVGAFVIAAPLQEFG